MIGWHHQLNGHELEQALGDGDAGVWMELRHMGQGVHTVQRPRECKKEPG